MDKPSVFEIRITGQISGQWSDWFEGLTIHHDKDGETTMKGILVDQSALIGVLTKLQALNLQIISVVKKSFEK